MTDEEIAWSRLAAQQLIGRPAATPADAVYRLGAVQAQDYPGAKWAVAQRTRGATSEEIDVAFASGAILRTHVLRPTWHFVSPKDIRWLLTLTAPRVRTHLAGYARRTGLDDELFRRSEVVIARALEGGRHRTRPELESALYSEGVQVSGLRLAFVMMNAELNGLVCSGAPRDGQFTYALLDERAPAAPGMSREQSLAELARRYFTSHGPATAHDCAWWSGLTVTDVRAGIALAGRSLKQVNCGGRPGWMAADAIPVAAADTVLHLLPNYDEHLVAYRDRTACIGAELSLILDSRGNPVMVHAVMLNGRMIGTWQRADWSGGTRVLLKPAGALNEPARSALAKAAGRYSSFLGRSVQLEDGNVTVSGAAS